MPHYTAHWYKLQEGIKFAVPCMPDGQKWFEEEVGVCNSNFYSVLLEKVLALGNQRGAVWCEGV